MLGVGRANEWDSGNSSELYVVTGHAPRHLDRNVTLIGRALHGLKHLSTLPRGSGSMGFYESAGEQTPILSIRFGDQVSAEEKLQIDILRTDTKTFRDLVEARRVRREEWFADSGGKVGLCNVPLPVRVKAQ
jgi:peptidylprolyl isomerase